MRVIQSVFIVSYLSLFVCYQCSLETDLINIFKQSEFVSPTDEQLQNFLAQVSQAAFSHDLQTLLSNSSVRAVFAEDIKKIFLTTSGQISLQVPNEKLIPILQREVEDMVGELIMENVKRSEVTNSKVVVSVPSSGVCANTYRVDVDVDVKVKPCGGFFGFLCPTARGNFDAHGCFQFDVTNWSIDVTTVNADADFDGSNLMGLLVELFSENKINNEVRSMIQKGFQNIDLGEDVDDQVEKAITSSIDEFAPQMASLVQNFNLDFDQQKLDSLLLEVKTFVLDILSTDFLSEVAMEIQLDYLTISIGF